jgi:CBS domain containing-hemolysin-like protein
MLLVLGFVLALVSLLLLTMQKTYYHLPGYELKRRARGEDARAKALYRAVAYESTLHVLLWTLIGISSAVAFVFLARGLSPLLAVVAVAVLVWWAFVWLPGGRVSKWSLTVTAWLTPVVVWPTSHLHPIVDRVQSWLPQPHYTQSDIYETEDLLAVLEHQKGHTEGRISDAELDSAQRVLTFSHKLVRDVVLPRRKLKLISADDPIGPILLNELNESGLENFVVYKDKVNNVVGTLSLHDAVEARGGSVADVMKSHLVYVNEAQSLAHVLQAFHSTTTHTFIVINSHDEFVGIVTIEQVLHEALGDAAAQDFEQFESRPAVANYQPMILEPVVEPVTEEPEVAEEPEHPEVMDEETLPPEPPEVIE